MCRLRHSQLRPPHCQHRTPAPADRQTQPPTPDLPPTAAGAALGYRRRVLRLPAGRPAWLLIDRAPGAGLLAVETPAGLPTSAATGSSAASAEVSSSPPLAAVDGL